MKFYVHAYEENVEEPVLRGLPKIDKTKVLKGTATLTISMFYQKELYKP